MSFCLSTLHMTTNASAILHYDETYGLAVFHALLIRVFLRIHTGKLPLRCIVASAIF